MFHSSACCFGTKSTGMSKIMPCMLLPRTAHILVVSVIIWADDSQVHLTSPTCKAELAAHIPNCLPLASLPRKCFTKACPQLQHPPSFNHRVPTPWYYTSPAAEAQHGYSMPHKKPSESSFRVSDLHLLHSLCQGGPSFRLYLPVWRNTSSPLPTLHLTPPHITLLKISLNQ